MAWTEPTKNQSLVVAYLAQCHCNKVQRNHADRNWDW
jgi:hypothetical protein